MLTDKIEKNPVSWNEAGSISGIRGEIRDWQGQEIILEHLGYI